MPRCVQIPFRLRERAWVINGLVEERVCVEEEDGRVIVGCC